MDLYKRKFTVEILNNTGTMATKKHQDFLNSHCRVCSRALGKTRYRTTKYELLLEYWGIDPTSDVTDVHPQFFCNSCYLMSRSYPDQRTEVFDLSGHHTTISYVTFVILFVKVEGLNENGLVDNQQTSVNTSTR